MGEFIAAFHIMKNSDTGTRTQVARVKAEYPNQLDYIGYIFFCYSAAK